MRLKTQNGLSNGTIHSVSNLLEIMFICKMWFDANPVKNQVHH